MTTRKRTDREDPALRRARESSEAELHNAICDEQHTAGREAIRECHARLAPDDHEKWLATGNATREGMAGILAGFDAPMNRAVLRAALAGFDGERAAVATLRAQHSQSGMDFAEPLPVSEFGEGDMGDLFA